MARNKDLEWHLPDGVPNGNGSHTHRWEAITPALLMDLRDELKMANRQLGNIVTSLGFDPDILRELRGLRRDVKKLERR